jgi:hypothetical protein
MLILPGEQAIGIGHIDPTAPDAVVTTRSRQVSDMMRWVQQMYYERELGLRRIDTDPYPDPNDAEHVAWRKSRLLASGPVQETGLEYRDAFLLDEAGQPRSDDNALVGLLVLSKPEGLCTPGEHRPTEILEFNVKPYFRGIGGLMLRDGLQTTLHPEDEAVLDIAEPNPTRAIYEHYTFQVSDLPPLRHGIFDVDHIRMHTPGHLLLAQLQVGH